MKGNLTWFDLRSWCTNPPAEPAWLLTGSDSTPGLWIEGHAGFVQGPPGSGKTWLVCDLAIAIATGTQALGKFDVSERGPVVLISEEGGQGSLYQRLVKLLRGRTIDPELLASDTIVGLSAQGFRLDNTAHRRQLITNLDALFPPPKLVVLDSLYRIHSGNENSTAEMTRFVAQIDEVRRAAPGAAFQVVHHSRKPSAERNGRDEGPVMRGSSVLSGWADAIITVNAKKSTPNICEVSCEKQREGAPFETFTIERVIDADSAVLDHREGGLDEARVRQAVTSVVTLLEKHPDGLNVTQLNRELKVRKEDLTLALNQLEAADTAYYEPGPRNSKIWKLR